MRIGIDARTAAGDAGVAQYGKNLLAAISRIDQDDEFVIFGKKKDATPFWSSHVGFRAEISQAKVDLLHVLGGAPPVGYRRPYILTVHDLAIYLHPEWFPDGQWFSTRIAYPLAVKFAKRIIVPSATTKRDLMKIFKVKEGKITVIPHGVDPPAPASLPVREEGDKRYVLFLGTIEPRKNISTLVRAFRRLIDREPELRDVELLIAGSAGWKTEATMDEIRKTQCEGYRITLLGRVEEEEKWKLLAAAACLAIPSLYEGFGLPVLEAMAVGTPVICSDVSSLPEAAGGAARLADPNDIEAWAAQLAAILKNKNTADELRERGWARAKELSWAKAAAATVKEYRAFSA